MGRNRSYERNHKFEITVDEAVCLVEFLEAEFIQGIGSDPDCIDLWYVKNIRSVYDKLQQFTDIHNGGN